MEVRGGASELSLEEEGRVSWVKMAGGQSDQILGALWRAWMGGSGLERLGRQGGKEGGRGWDPGGEGKASGG